MDGRCKLIYYKVCRQFILWKIRSLLHYLPYHLIKVRVEDLLFIKFKLIFLFFLFLFLFLNPGLARSMKGPAQTIRPKPTQLR